MIPSAWIGQNKIKSRSETSSQQLVVAVVVVVESLLTAQVQETQLLLPLGYRL